MTRDYKSKGILLFLITFLVITVVTVLWLIPKVKDVFEMRRKIAEQKIKLSKLTEKLALLEGIDEYELEKKVEFLLAAVPEENDVFKIILVIKTLAFDNSLSLKDLKISLSGEFSFKVIGEVNKVMNFIKDIERVVPILTLDSLAFSNEGPQAVEVFMKGKNFYLAVPKEIGSIESPLPLLTSEEEKIYQYVSNFKNIDRGGLFTPMQSGKENPFNL